MVRGLKNKDDDQLRGYRAADLRPYFASAKSRFSLMLLKMIIGEMHGLMYFDLFLRNSN